MFLQDLVTEPAAAAETPQSLWSIIMNSGSGSIIILGILFLMFAFMVYLFVERLTTIKKASQEDSSFMAPIRHHIHDGKIDSAVRLCEQTDTPSARMVGKGISRIGRPMNDLSVAVENVGNIEVAKLEKGLVILASIAGGAPMLGFLGTVTGMFATFQSMAAKAGGVVNLQDLSSGMYQAMLTTIAGLIVGIIAYFAYNYLVSQIDSVVRKLESRTMEFLDLLNEPA